MNTIKEALHRMLGTRKQRLPYWHGTCSLDHRTAEEAERCSRTD
jgi:hypothetical protein